MIDKIFHRLNIYGWEPVEDYLLAALLTGGNLLLVGEKGSGKNFAVSRIAKAMDIKFTIINACTAQISDLIGFYNPRSLSEGKLEYVNSPLTDRKFLMIDEVNRSHLNLQNQLIELLNLPRQLMGQPLEELVFVWAAMNQGSQYFATEPLDPAFTGKFSFFIPVPCASDMKDEDLNKLLDLKNAVNAPGLSYWKEAQTDKDVQSGTNVLQKFLRRAATKYGRIEKEYGEFIKCYLINLQRVLSNENGYELDGRRMKMIYRNSLSYLSVLKTKTGRDVENITEIMRQAIKYSIPWDIGGSEQSIGEVQFEAAHSLTKSAIKNSFVMKLYRSDSIEKIEFLIKGELSIFEKRKVLNHLLDASDKIESILVPLLLAPFCLIKSSPLSEVIRVEILKGLKNKLYEYFLVKNKKIKDMDDLKIFITPGNKNLEMKIDYIANTLGGKLGNNDAQCRQIDKKVRQFLLDGRKRLKQIYDEYSKK